MNRYFQNDPFTFFRPDPMQLALPNALRIWNQNQTPKHKKCKQKKRTPQS